MPKGLTPHSIIYDLVTAGDPQISPDGTTLLFTKSWAEPDEANSRSAVWIANADGSNQRLLAGEGKRSSQARWSPDGARIAFVSDRGDRGNAILVMPAGGGEATELARHRGGINGLSWSPDGVTLAYTSVFDPDDPEDQGPDKDAAPPIRVVRRIDYKQDNRGFLNDVRQQIWLANTDGSGARTLTSESFDFEFPQWSPDGSTLAAKILLRNGMEGQLGLVDVATGTVSRIGPEHGTVGVFAWSPDGNAILFGGDTEQTWQYDLFLYDLASKTIERLTGDLQVQPDAGFATVSPPSQPVWLDGETVLLPAFRGGASGLYRFDIETRALHPVQTSDAVFSGSSFDRQSGTIYQAGSSLDGTGQIVRTTLDPPSTTVIVDLNADFLQKTPPAGWETFQIERNGCQIDAWVLKPPGFDPAKRYPMVLDIHGGPNSWYGPGFTPVPQALAGA
ncbi:MAG: S9 family peptidase, partial [Thermomicrobiales bacterium]|nr:S9 family peptidase [Thermomicrobiales bacterium]